MCWHNGRLERADSLAGTATRTDGILMYRADMLPSLRERDHLEDLCVCETYSLSRMQEMSIKISAACAEDNSIDKR